MSNALSEMDRELLGEVSYNDGGEATMAKVRGGPGNGAFEGSHGAMFTPLNAAAGTLMKISNNGDELEPGSETQETVTEDTNAVPKTPKKRGAGTAASDESSQPAKKRSLAKKATSTTTGAGADSITTKNSITATKKRASPKGKGVADADASTVEQETDGETEGLEPVTPKKGKRAATNAKAVKTENDINAIDGPTESTDKSASSAKGNGEVEGMTVHNTPRKRQAPKKEIIAPRGIPSSWDEADDADRMLVTMKEKGEGWSEIRTAWKAATGQDTASSTLPNRYNRIKVNMMRMKEGDAKHLLAAKKDVEDSFNANFWSNVTANMERRGADKYPAAFVQKTFKELEAAGKADLDATDDAGAAASGSKDTDGAKSADGSKTSARVKKAARAKKTIAAKDTTTNEAHEDVVVKEEETGDGGDGDA